MDKLKSFDVFEMVSSGLSDDFTKNYEVNETKLQKLKEKCEALDVLMDDGRGFEVDISEETGEIFITCIFGGVWD